MTMPADEELLRRAVAYARPHNSGERARWVAVMYSFGLGSTYASDLCRRFGFDPDEKVAR